MKQLVIFDLDGTLLDTIADLGASCNAVLEKNELPTYEMEEYKSFVGSGMMRLVERAIPEQRRTDAFISKIRTEFVEHYFNNIADHTTIYPEIEKLLAALKKRGVNLAVASNKFQDGTRKLVTHFFPTIKFEAVLGQRPNVPLKPNPQIVRDILSISTYAADKTLYVGDSGIDIETAKAAGVESVGVTWGFRSREELEAAGADHIVDGAMDILKFIE
ncbi:MAG: HAD family hydrolase [Rikenellaceae bacterium]